MPAAIGLHSFQVRQLAQCLVQPKLPEVLDLANKKSGHPAVPKSSGCLAGPTVASRHQLPCTSSRTHRAWKVLKQLFVGNVLNFLRSKRRWQTPWTRKHLSLVIHVLERTLRRAPASKAC